MKNSGKYNTKRWEEGKCTLHCDCWLKSSDISHYSRPFKEFWRHLVGGGYPGETFIQE